MATTFGQQVRARRRELGMSQNELARAVNGHPQTIHRIEQGTIKFSRYLSSIRATLGIEEEDDKNPSSASHAGFESSNPSGDPSYLPVFLSSTVIEEEDLMILTMTPVTSIPRPFFLDNLADTYAIKIATDNMSPLFEIGDTVFVNPNEPPQPGKDVVLRQTRSGQVTSIIIAKLLATDRNDWALLQHNRATVKQFSVTRALYPICHRIVGKLSR